MSRGKKNLGGEQTQWEREKVEQKKMSECGWGIEWDFPSSVTFLQVSLVFLLILTDLPAVILSAI